MGTPFAYGFSSKMGEYKTANPGSSGRNILYVRYCCGNGKSKDLAVKSRNANCADDPSTCYCKNRHRYR